MNTLRTLLLVAALTVATTFGAQAAGCSIELWVPADVITSPLGTSVLDIEHALEAKGVSTTQHQGSISQGNYAITFKDGAQQNTIQLTFDTQNNLDAASTWYTAADARNATDMLQSIMTRVEKQGGQRVEMGNADLNDGSVSYSVNNGGDVRTITVGRNADEPNVIWVVTSR